MPSVNMIDEEGLKRMIDIPKVLTKDAVEKKINEQRVEVNDKINDMRGELNIVKDSFIDCREKLKGHSSMIAVNTNNIKNLEKKLDTEGIRIQKISTDVYVINEHIEDINNSIKSLDLKQEEINEDINTLNTKIRKTNKIMKTFTNKFDILIFVLFFLMIGLPLISTILFIRTGKMLDRIDRIETELEIKHPDIIEEIEIEDEEEKVSKVTC